MNVGGQELLLIFLVVLLLFGPKRIPEVARLLARISREIRKIVDEIRHEIEDNDIFKG
jgi:sec-independent protein translocase protein TatA